MSAASHDSLEILVPRWFVDGDYQTIINRTGAVDSGTHSPNLAYYRAMSFAQLYAYPQAQASFQQALHADSLNVKYRYQYGRFLSQAGFVDASLAELAACMRIDSTYLPAAFQLGLLLNTQKTDPAREVAIFSYLIRQNPNDFLSLYYKGDALKRLDLEDSGIVFIEQSIALNPRYFPSLIAAAHYHNAQKDVAKALDLYERAETIRPRDKDLLVAIGDCHRKLKNFRTAIGYFHKALEIDSTTALGWAQLGYTYYSINRFDSAAAAYQSALVFDDENAVYYTNLAEVYEKMDSVQCVISTYLQAIASRHAENIAYLYRTLANYYSSKRMFREAAEAYERVYEYHPSDLMALYWSGNCYVSVPDKPTAIATFERYLHLLEADSTKTPDERKFVSNYIRQLKKQGK